MKTTIIAEIGENHLGKIELAKRMIQEAAIAGADIVKFQSYRGQDIKDDDPEKKWFQKVELSNEYHFELKRFAEANGIEFLSSPFSKERARFLVEELGLKRLKIASGIMLDYSILDYINNVGVDELFLSTGMATLDEIRLSVQHLRNIKNISIMHCTTQYPCKDEDANLLSIKLLQEKFSDYSIGYSDHTTGIDTCLAAVALGAQIIEKHFTLNRQWREGTDHILSLEPKDFKDMVDRIRRVEILLGKKQKEPTSQEKKIVEFVRTRFQNQQ